MSKCLVKCCPFFYSYVVIIPDSFSQYFATIYGARWPKLLQSLQAKELQVARGNFFAGTETLKIFDFKEIPRSESGLLSYYIMDPASIVAAQAVGVQVDDRVLDMCAAPGGKSLILAEALRGSGELIANEISEVRRNRMKKIFQQYIPREQRENIRITGKDAGKFALTHAEYFDRVLVDAPCSGERHLLCTPSELSTWSVGRSEKLAQRQYALLTAALIAVKAGGCIVYSTCSINPIENDQVIARLIKKKGDRFKFVKQDLLGAENTEYGNIYLPDNNFGGPIYISILRKV